MTQQVVCEGLGQRCQRACFWASAALPDVANLRFLLHEANAAYEDGDLDHAESLILFILKQVQQVPNPLWRIASETARLALLLARGDWASVKSMASALESEIREQIGHEAGEQLMDVYFMLALACYDSQDQKEFRRAYEALAHMGLGECGCHARLRVQVLTGLKDLWRGQFATARQAFASILKFRAVSNFYYLIGRLGIAEAYACEGNDNAAIEQLEQIEGYLSAGTCHGVSVGWLMRFTHTARLAHREFPHWPFEAAPASGLAKTLSQRRVDAPLRIHAFGRPRVYSHGVEVNFTKAYRSLGMLAFVAGHPEGVTVEQTLMELFPKTVSDSPIDKHLATIRLILKDHTLITQQHGVLAVPRDTWLDWVEYDDAFDRAKRLPLENRAEGFQTALSLYKGKFLMGVHSAWSLQQMRHYEEAQGWLCWQMAALCNKLGSPHEALHWLEQSLRENHYFDRAACDILRLWEQMDMRSRAILFAQEYIERMQLTFHGNPSPTFMELYRRMKEEDRLVTGAFNREDLLRPTGAPQLGRVLSTQEQVASIQTALLPPKAATISPAAPPPSPDTLELLRSEAVSRPRRRARA